MYSQSPCNLPRQIQDFNISNANITEWNIQGIAKKKAVLADLVA